MFSHVIARILVPIADNDGQPFTEVDWSWLENALFDLANGFSLEGLVDGAWRDPKTGTVYRDKSRRYATAIRADQVDAIHALAEVCKARFRQEAIFLEVSSTPVVAFI